MTNRLSQLGALLGAFFMVATAACVSSTGPDGRSRFCWYPGDTIALLEEVDPSTHRTVACHWVLADKLTCFEQPVGPQLATADCVIGTKYGG